MATLQKTHEILGLVGSVIDEIALRVLHSAPPEFENPRRPPYHVTLFSSEELDSISTDHLEKSAKLDATKVIPLGLGGNRRVFFVVIIWAAGQLFRKQIGLPPRQFHITLSQQDDPNLDKGVASVLPGHFPSAASVDLLDHLAFTLHLSGLFQQEQPYCVDLIRAFPESPRGYSRLADAAISIHEYKLAMLAYGRAFERATDERVKEYCLKKLLECAKETEWGSVMRQAELTQIPDAIADILLAPWGSELRIRLSDMEFVPTMQLESRLPLYIPWTRPPFKLPRWFRWLIPYHLAIMSTPRNEEDIAALASPHLGIRHVLTLTEEEPLPKKWFHGKPITNTFLPVENYGPPSIEQMDLIMRLVDDETKLPLLVHCGGGKGRAGTVAACYLAAYGFHKPVPHQASPEMTAPDAIASLRLIRPGSLETSRQEAFVSRWCSTIWKRQSVYPDLPSEPPPCALEVKGTLDKNSDLFVLVGLPGAGKSFFTRALCARSPRGWSRISQDDSGSRAACENEISHAKGRVLLDRCNTSAADRKIWLGLASNWASAPVCIWFDYEKVLCESRAQRRAGHPTLPPGNRVRNAVDQMHKALVPPTLKEGFKAIVHVKSFAAAEDLILRLSPPVDIYKFPRTPHLINLGAATDDDVVTDIPAVAGNVVITEKVDGANMGFWLSSAREIRVQNRSHYVSPASHPQFKKLGVWVDAHRDELMHILGRDAHFASRYILYGEWLAATHSIVYARLPDQFMAFDLYDRSTESWADRATLAALLADTTIQIVPVLHEGAMPSEADLRGMVQLPSKFWDGRIEGIYVKVERDGQVLSRGKVVRSDFIAGNEHWTKGNLQLNELVQVTPDDPKTFLEQYGVKENDAVLADVVQVEGRKIDQLEIYKDIRNPKYEIAYVAGGASQNTARGAAYLLGKDSVVFTGCVGNDDLKGQLEAANKAAGLITEYQVNGAFETGACAVIINGKNRSLVTTLRAAEHYENTFKETGTKENKETSKIAQYVQDAKVFYIEGYFLTHGTETIRSLIQKTTDSAPSKVFALNLSAPFIPKFFNSNLQQIIEDIDIVICNESEAEEWANANATEHPELLPESERKNVRAVARAIAKLDKKNKDRPRIVVVTQGAESTVVVSVDHRSVEPVVTDVPDVRVPALKGDIVDTNGAGDAFAGGFLGGYIHNKVYDADKPDAASIVKCVQAGHKLAGSSIQLVGPQYPLNEKPSDLAQWLADA
ncbi:pfkB family carbohydrate kinase-domain-containing protein [Mycena maculata]|uniref:PfkB family carbohydrate kinase-domain-containing protein n=1 Tax=Mycena maculata TaxID=230809 RepID=A0AAD7JD34_9AGAR|nr:pfkB family carbohydrate kinase-domain-containing protein [Mycena maculata]